LDQTGNQLGDKPTDQAGSDFKSLNFYFALLFMSDSLSYYFEKFKLSKFDAKQYNYYQKQNV
jgi:hypothetical protein